MTNNMTNPMHLDILKEIGNIGAGNATTSLSKLLNKTIEMEVPSVVVVPLSEILNVYEKYETEVAATFFRIEGDISGNFMITFPIKQANELIRDMVTDRQSMAVEDLTSQVGSSAFMEIGNILAGTYLSALSDFTHLKITLTPPDLVADMMSTIITEGLIDISAYVDEGIIIETSLVEHCDQTKKQIKGQFFLLPNPQSLEKIYLSLGI